MFCIMGACISFACLIMCLGLQFVDWLFSEKHWVFDYVSTGMFGKGIFYFSIAANICAVLLLPNYLSLPNERYSPKFDSGVNWGRDGF